MSLEQWLQRNNWLRPHEPSLPEIEQLLAVVDREISDAQAQGLSADGQFQHAYDASLQLCTIALYACGYDAQKGQSKHKRTIDSLQYTLGADWSEVADHIERASRLRGQATYERIGVVSQRDADELLEVAQQLRSDVLQWLKTDHAELVPPEM